MTDHLKRFKVKVVWPTVAMILVGSLLVWQVMGAILAMIVTEDGGPGPGALPLLIIGSICKWIFLIVGSGAVLLGGLKIFSWLAVNFGDLFGVEFDSEPEQEVKSEGLPPVLMEEVETVSHTMQQMEKRIALIEERRARARIELTTINTLAATLVRLVQAVAAKADAMDRERQRLDDLRAAVRQGDSEAIAQMAGRVGDGVVMRLATDKNRQLYQDRFLDMLATEIGGLEARAETMQRLANTWVGQLSAFRLQMDSLSMIVDTAEALPVITEIQGRLTAAQETLGMDQPTLEHIMVAGRIPRVLVAPGRVIDER